MDQSGCDSVMSCTHIGNWWYLNVNIDSCQHRVRRRIIWGFEDKTLRILDFIVYLITRQFKDTEKNWRLESECTGALPVQFAVAAADSKTHEHLRGGLRADFIYSIRSAEPLSVLLSSVLTPLKWPLSLSPSLYRSISPSIYWSDSSSF